MAQKYVDPFGNTPKVKIHLSEARKRALSLDEWFVEYHNVDTRNAISQALKLVDHDGDTIFYIGEKNGFKVSFDKVLFLINSRHNGVFRFTAYHKKLNARSWSQWKEHKKSPKEIVNIHIRKGNVANVSKK